LETADRVFGERKYADALKAYEGAARDAATEQNVRVAVEAHSQVARCHSLLHDLEEGRKWLARAKERASIDEPWGWSRYLGVRGILERESGDRTAAKATFEELYRYCIDKNLHARAVDAVHHLAIVVPPEEQPAWALKGIAAAEKLNNAAQLAVLWNNLGATYEDLKQYDAMLDAYRRARDYHYASGGPLQKLIADWAVGHAFRIKGELPRAREWLEKSLKQAEDLRRVDPAAPTAEWIGWSKKDLGETLVAEGDPARGLLLLKEARRFLVESGIQKDWPEGLEALDATIRKTERSQ
jgi:tetratricopeptide (TPR) repeat protein